jgi:hypothetical protein
MVSVPSSTAVHHGFIGGVIVSVPSSSAVHHGFIGGVMASVPSSSAVPPGFDPRSGKSKYYNIDICCFSVKQAALRRKSKD